MDILTVASCREARIEMVPIVMLMETVFEPRVERNLKCALAVVILHSKIEMNKSG